MVRISLLYCGFCATHEGSFHHGAQSTDSIFKVGSVRSEDWVFATRDALVRHVTISYHILVLFHLSNMPHCTIK